jgi:hypothetical protein
MAANWARRIDPTLAAKYQRLMLREGKHHNSALCHISTHLLNRIIACWRAGEHYVIRDTDGRVLTRDEAKLICQTRYSITEELRVQRRTGRRPVGTSRRRKESTSAPSIGSSPTETRTPIGA